MHLQLRRWKQHGQALYPCRPGSISGQVGFGGQSGRREGFSPITLVSPANSHPTNCSIFIYHPVINTL